MTQIGGALDLQVLGPVRALLDGRAVELGPARRRTLLAALCVQPGQVLSVDTLADRVWDGDPPAKSTATVHAYVSRLRSSLRTFAPDGSERPSPLRTHSPGYRLDVPLPALDEHRFAAAVASARALRAEHRPDEARRSVRAGLALWRGEAYVDIAAGFARREADRLADARVGAEELAVQIDLDLGRHEALLTELAALVDAHPLREGLHAALMLALYRSGRQADALQHFGRVREQMGDELGVDPGPGLRRLHAQILRQAPELDVAPVRAGRAGPDVTPAPGADEVSTGWRLVGRDAELARITRLLDRAGPAAVAAVAVVGEAGIGKTRLLEEAAATAAGRGARVTWGRCWQHEGAPVLWPWVQALGALVDQASPEERRAAAAGRGRPAVALLPQLESVRETGPVDPAPVRLYDAVAHVVTTITRSRPAVLVLEDMHWADRASRELAEYLVSNVADARLTVLLSVRSPNEDSSRAGSELLTALARSGRTERIVLGGLSAAAVRSYVADRTGSQLDEPTSEALVDRTSGNPFFVGELVHLLVTDSAGLEESVPDSIREVVTRRLRRLTETDQTVLGVAAVLGRTFDLDLVGAAARLDEDVVDEAVDRATERGIICSDPAAVGHHRFVHALTQQTLLDATGPARLRRLHGRVAEAIQARHGAADLSAATVESLAYHLACAGTQPELTRAVDLSLDAADTAVRDGNYPEAESLLLRALDLTDRLDDASATAREMATRLRLWSMYTATQGPGAPGAVAHHERASELVRRHGGARDLMAAHQAAYARAVFSDDLRTVEELVREMAAAADASGDDLMHAAAHLARAQLCTHRGRPAQALAACRAVEALGDPLDDVPAGVFPITPGCSLRLWQGIAGTVLGEEQLVARALADLGGRVRGAGPTTVAYVHVNLAFLHVLRDDPGPALHHADEGWRQAEQHRFVEASMFVDVLRAWARERTEPGRHLDDLDRAVAATRVMPTLALRPSLLAAVADVHLRAGRVDAAAGALDAGLAESALTGDELSLAELHRLRAATLGAGGGPSGSVRAELDRAEQVARDQGAALFAARVRATRVSV